MVRRRFTRLERLIGAECGNCHKRVREREKIHNHHKDGNKHNNTKKNQVWLCLKCHKEISRFQQHGRPRSTATVQLAKSRGASISPKKPAGEGSATEYVKSIVPYDEGSPQMQANEQFEGAWRNYCEARLRSEGRILKKTAINAGSEAVGCNPKTAYGYWNKWTSEEGPAREMTDEFHNKFAVWRHVPPDLIEAPDDSSNNVGK